jgi:hypothetical protein
VWVVSSDASLALPRAVAAAWRAAFIAPRASTVDLSGLAAACDSGGEERASFAGEERARVVALSLARRAGDGGDDLGVHGIYELSAPVAPACRRRGAGRPACARVARVVYRRPGVGGAGGGEASWRLHRHGHGELKPKSYSKEADAWIGKAGTPANAAFLRAAVLGA